MNGNSAGRSLCVVLATLAALRLGSGQTALAEAVTAQAAATTPIPATVVEKTVVAPKPVLIPYGEQIYRVTVTLGVEPGSGIPRREAQRLVSQLKSLVDARIGKWWSCSVLLSSAGEPLNRAMLDHRTAVEWNAALNPTAIEKSFALTLDREGTEFRLSGVEWDRSSQSVTGIEERSTYDRRVIPNYATDLVFALFRPLVSITTVDKNQVEMRVRGGELLPPDVSLTPFTVGDYISSFTRLLDKNRELKRLQMIPWTQIRVDVADRSYLKGTIISAFASPLGGSRRRVEMMGLKIRPPQGLTRLQVIPRGKPDSPMAGYRVEVLDRLETKEDKVTDRVTLRTDRNGIVVIPADPTKPLRHLIVYSGAAPLAKAPLIPGHARKLVLEAPDDAPRLNVEAETELLQSELVDVVARREVLMARARGASQKDNWDLVSDMEKQVDTLPTLEQFQVRIEALKNPAVQTAKRNKDRGQESRIVRMCKQISEMAILHLDPLKVKEFKTDMAELKKTK